jgi:MinD-like ATPase involved in chromosome partitioning or flagellar assembly
MKIDVVVAVRGSREGEVATAIGADARLALARRCADLVEALAVAHAGAADVVVVSEQPQLDRDAVAQLADSGVVVVGVPSSPDSADHLRALGIEHLIAGNADAEEIAQAIVTAADQQPRSTPPGKAIPAPRTQRLGRVVVVWGPQGAPGRTTIAVNLAAELGARASTLLVDVDTYGGAVAQALGLLDEAPGIAALARASLHGSLSDDAVARHALMVTPGLRVLTGITRADRWNELSAAALAPVWELLRGHADFVVVDAGFCLERDEELQYDTHAPQRNGATLSALESADVVLAVGSAEPLSMQRLVHGLGALDTLVPTEDVPRIVAVNRVRSSVAGARPREAVADALARYSGVEHVWTVPFDAKGCDAATLAGQTLQERAPHSPARRAIVALAEAVATATMSRRESMPQAASAALAAASR